MTNEFLNKWCKNVSIMPRDPVDSTTTRGLHVEIADVPVEKFKFKYQSIDIDGLPNQRMMHVMLKKMRKAPFDWLVPIHSDPLGAAEADYLVSASVAAGQTSLSIVRPETGIYLEVGDWVKFSNHDKVYTVASQATGVNPSIELLEPLIYPIDNTTTMITRNVTVKVMQDPETDPVVYDRVAGDLDASFEIELIEL